VAQLGNKKNAQLNGEWGKHVRKRDGRKRLTSSRRRGQDKEVISDEREEAGRKEIHDNP
jgi:hypothetical protein